MKNVWLATLAMATCMGAVGGCSSPSLHPLAGPDSLVQDYGLPGEWATDGPTVTRVIVTETPDGKYSGALTIHQNAEAKAALGLEISLTQIESDHYVDLFLAKPDRERLAAKFGFLALPVHQLMMVQREEDTLTVWTFDAEWLRRAGKERSFACEVLPIAGRDVAVITAETGSLRQYLSKHAHDRGVLSAPMVFHRVGAGMKIGGASSSETTQ